MKMRYLPYFALLLSFCIYSVWVYTIGTEKMYASTIIDAPQAGTKALKGKALYQKYNCQSCHQIFGLGGYLGPELTNTIGQKGKGEIYAKAIIQNGLGRMPKFNLTENEIDELVAYLVFVDQNTIVGRKGSSFEMNSKRPDNEANRK